MYKFFGGNKSKMPSASKSQPQKAKQIESLNKVNAVEILRDIEYRVVIQNGSVDITLIIALPLQFPQEKPIITVSPCVNHPWVDASSYRVIGCPAINTFSMQGDLGEAVLSIVEEFSRTPPIPHPQLILTPVKHACSGACRSGCPQVSTSCGLSAAFPPTTHELCDFGPPPYPSSSCLSNGNQKEVMAGSFRHDAMPDIWKLFPQLKEKNMMELQGMIDNEELLIEMVLDLHDFKVFSKGRKALSQACIQLARKNFSQEPKIKELKDEISKKTAECDRLVMSYEEDCRRHAELSDQLHPFNIQSNLKVAILQAEEESETVVDDFFTGKLDVNAFLHDIVEKRKLYHIRKAKEEKLSHIINSSSGAY